LRKISPSSNTRRKDPRLAHPAAQLTARRSRPTAPARPKQHRKRFTIPGKISPSQRLSDAASSWKSRLAITCISGRRVSFAAYGMASLSGEVGAGIALCDGHAFHVRCSCVACPHALFPPAPRENETMTRTGRNTQDSTLDSDIHAEHLV
jgi:hypothetical protein